MDQKQYTQAALRTEYESYDKMKDRLQNTELMRLLHAGMGMCTEAGEFQDMLKRVIFYGKELDRTNLIEEIGDMLWYCAVACDTLQVSMEDVMRRNILKLQTRYPDKFTEEAALNRDTTKERTVLESEDKIDTKRNLCDSCIHDYPNCPAVGGEVVYGDGTGYDNICKCKKYNNINTKEDKES